MYKVITMCIYHIKSFNPYDSPVRSVIIIFSTLVFGKTRHQRGEVICPESHSKWLR